MFTRYKEKVKQSPVLLFLWKGLIFFGIVLILDISLGKVLGHYYITQKGGIYSRTTYSIEGTNEDILIFGSSRACHHYQPEILEKILHRSCYNVGRDGNTIFYHYAVFKSILKRYKPKMIILDFSWRDLEKDDNSYYRISSLLPYYKRHPEMFEIVELRGESEKFKLLSSIYPYNSIVSTIFMRNLGRGESGGGDINGYLPLSGVWTTPIKANHYTAKALFDSNKVKYFKSFIEDCKKANIELIIVCSPYFVKTEKPDSSLMLAKSLAASNNVSFFDAGQLPFFLANATFFTDELHLNNSGARIFTTVIAAMIAHDHPQR